MDKYTNNFRKNTPVMKYDLHGMEKIRQRNQINLDHRLKEFKLSIKFCLRLKKKKKLT